MYAGKWWDNERKCVIMFNSIRFYCSLPSWVACACNKLDRHVANYADKKYIPYEIVEDTIQECFTDDHNQHAAYYNEFMLHLDSIWNRDKAEYTGIITGLFLANAYRGLDDVLIELVRQDQKEHLKELDIND